jgi:hypothetical protein
MHQDEILVFIREIGRLIDNFKRSQDPKIENMSGRMSFSSAL